MFSFPNCLKCNEVNYSCFCDNYYTEEFQDDCQTTEDYRNCFCHLMVCPSLTEVGHGQGLVLVKVLRQLLRARLIKHFKQSVDVQKMNNAYDLVLISSVLRCPNSEVLVLLC